MFKNKRQEIAIFAVLFLLLSINEANASSTSIGLYNTGVGDNNAILLAGATDSHYTVTSSLPSSTALTYAVNDAKDYIGYWMAPDSKSTWITPFLTSDNYASSNSQLAEYYDYTTTFNLAGINISTVDILGKAASDNYILGVSLNGHEQSLSGGYSAWTAFEVNQYFNQGSNTIVFHTQNLGGSSGSGGPTGLRVQMDLAPGLATVPVPAAIWLFGSALAGFVGFNRRKNK
jgi:hypothetical protein